VTFVWLPPDELVPNLYNPNVLDDDLYAKAVASIERYGFVDPVTAREVEGVYVIIDGEHRVRAAKELELALVPVIVVVCSDDDAEQLTLVLNELRGRPDRAKLQSILTGLAERHPIADLMATLPYAREQFMAISAPPPIVPPVAGEPAVRWVERMYRLPRPAADTLDAALAQAKQYEEVTDDWRALEALARRYLEES
jgi:hypothetical protein